MSKDDPNSKCSDCTAIKKDGMVFFASQVKSSHKPDKKVQQKKVEKAKREK